MTLDKETIDGDDLSSLNYLNIADQQLFNGYVLDMVLTDNVDVLAIGNRV